MVENGLQTIAPEELGDLLDFYDIEDGALSASPSSTSPPTNQDHGNGRSSTGFPLQPWTWPASKRTPPRSATSSPASFLDYSRFPTMRGRSSQSAALNTRAMWRRWLTSGCPASGF